MPNIPGHTSDMIPGIYGEASLIREREITNQCYNNFLEYFGKKYCADDEHCLDRFDEPEMMEAFYRELETFCDDPSVWETVRGLTDEQVFESIDGRIWQKATRK